MEVDPKVHQGAIKTRHKTLRCLRGTAQRAHHRRTAAHGAQYEVHGQIRQFAPENEELKNAKSKALAPTNPIARAAMVVESVTSSLCSRILPTAE
eukprot:CAMPEP_0115861818 /NCGR_PEP_ID=MMETSP0287-20121206/17853_1 /TAXON_ID=412157 /ORGANISM="Chrysochromulina rotalis, Strain UIO044" /LENGTH=94 /DNA_ID=CAMNT_0003316213 /DNA_START=114 /DNA_END=398 /DNA_ORIENTATION=-